MATSRRRFLKTGAVSAICAGVPGVVSAAARSAASEAFPSESLGKPGNYSKDSFAPLVNTRFLIHDGAMEGLEVVLEKITDLKAPGNNPSAECFVLSFKGSLKAARLSQRTYVVEHDKRGKFALFLVPAGNQQNGQYRAVINNL